jgi:hypothetical protein
MRNQFKKLLVFFALIFSTGCISIPIPPTGDRMGDFGRIQLSVSIKYFPQQKLDWFNPIIPQPKLYKEK